MNIFCTSDDPIQSALWLDDKRVVKMILESAQMLSTNVNLFRSSQDHSLYRVAFRNHPCTRWARTSSQNFNWLCAHATALCQIYQIVYNKEHRTWPVIQRAERYGGLFPSIGLTTFANATPFKTPQDEADGMPAVYRRFMNHKWHNLDTRTPAWSRRPTPEWSLF